jgi:membrane associated rhomboid family serine protease
MFPLKDEQYLGGFPLATLVIIALTGYVFWLEFSAADVEAFISQWALIPAKVNFVNVNTLIPFVTAMFLHAGFLHILSNLWFFWVYGPNVEALLGKIKYILFYLGGGVIANIAQYLTMPTGDIPVVGASGAIAAVLGFYLVKFPHHRIVTLVPFVFLFTTVSLPAVLVLFIWFLTQLLNGTADLSVATAASAGVAWWAHIGGFLFGMFIALFTKKR